MRDLPKGWMQIPLESVAANTRYPIGDGDHGQIKPACYTEKGIPYIRVADMGWGKFAPNGMVHIPEDIHNENLKSELFHGDIIIAKTGATIGKCCIIPQRIAKANTTSSVGKVTVDRGVTSPEWVLFYFLSKDFKDQMWAVSEKTAQPGFNIKDLKKFIIPLAPLNEQHRIAEKLERLLHKVDTCKKRLEKIPAILKRFRQSILDAACSGRLTADWREKNPKELPDTTPEAAPFEVPETWRWVKLYETGNMNRGKSRHRPRDAAFLYGGPYPFIQTGDIAQSGGRITSHKQTYSEAGLAQSRLWPEGAICITIAANIAESAILTYPTCFPDSVVGIIANKNICVPQYIEYFIRVAKSDLSTFAPATAQKNINIAILNEVLVPLPPLQEQKEVVRRLEALFKKADEIEARYKKAKAFVDRLTQSILAKAFRGELVPQDPNDEPASVLLERIKIEKGRLEEAKKKGTKQR